MLFEIRLALLALMGATSMAKEIPVDPIKDEQLYRSGVVHNTIMENKARTWEAQEAAGAFDATQYRGIDGVIPCVDGKATAVEGDALNTFRCNNIDLYHFLSHAELGSATGRGSSSWGWTSEDGREFVAIGQADGTAFVEISKEGKLVYLGRLPHNSIASIWREIRVYDHYAVIGSEAVGHNIQLFDFHKLLDLDPASPKTFSNVTDVTGQFTGLPNGRTHNVVTNTESGWAYAVGAQPRTSACKAGLIFIDLSDPSNPVSPGCNGDDGYVHDAQCLIYKGPHAQYVGREICYGYNEDTLTIYDVHDKSNTSIISRTSYQGASYTHQGWVLDTEWQNYLLLDDEYDEYDRVEPAANGHPVTYIWDISDLANPRQTGYFKNERAYSVDHNQYVVDGFTYQSNYGSGLAVLDVRSIPEDPTGAGVKEVAYFDIYPEDDSQPNGGIVDFVGTWSSYAFFKSGYIFVNTIERGGFVLKVHKEALK